MTSAGWLVLAGAALVGHELIVSRSGAKGWRGFRARALRYSFLLLALVAAARVGPSVIARLVDVAPRREPQSVDFVAKGDPAFTQALSRQQPDSPYPSGQPSEVIEQWRGHVIQALRDRAGVMAEASSPVPVTVVSSEVVGDIRRSLVTFLSWDGTEVPAYVHEPQAPSVRPKAAVLVVAGHGSGIAATAGLIEDYQHAAALELARRGYVTLSPELRGFGLLGVTESSNHRFVAAAALEAGSSYKAIVVRDLGRALSVLERWPGVDPARLAVAGTSLGGELAVLLGALDQRVRVVVSNSYGGSVGPVTVQNDAPDEAGQTPHGCHTIPGSNHILLLEDWGRLIAPRPLIVVRGNRNTPGETNAFRDAVQETYAALGAADSFDFAIEQGGHEFYLAATVRFLGRWL